MPTSGDEGVKRSGGDLSTDDADSHLETVPPADEPESKASQGPSKASEYNQNGDGEYLVAVNYQSDAERKRIEYLLSTSPEIEVEKIRGLTRLVRAGDDEFEAFYENLTAKVDDLDHLRVKELAEIDITPDEHHERFSLETGASPDQVKWAFESIKRRRDATVEDSSSGSDTTYRQYVATTQSGTVRYSYEVSEGLGGDTRIDVHVWGYGDAPEVLRSFIEEELTYTMEVNDIDR